MAKRLSDQLKLQELHERLDAKCSLYDEGCEPCDAGDQDFGHGCFRDEFGITHEFAIAEPSGTGFWSRLWTWFEWCR